MRGAIQTREEFLGNVPERSHSVFEPGRVDPVPHALKVRRMPSGHDQSQVGPPIGDQRERVDESLGIFLPLVVGDVSAVEGPEMSSARRTSSRAASTDGGGRNIS